MEEVVANWESSTFLGKQSDWGHAQQVMPNQVILSANILSNHSVVQGFLIGALSVYHDPL